MAKKDKIAEMIDEKKAPGQSGKKKKYLIDHRTVWDAEHDRALVTADGVDSGRRVIETSNVKMQEKLEKLGYSSTKDNKLMHRTHQVKPESIRSAKEVDEINK